MASYLISSGKDDAISRLLPPFDAAEQTSSPSDINGAALSPDGALYAVATASNGILVYTTSDWQQVANPTPGNPVHAVAFSPDGSMLAFARGGAPHWGVLSTADYSPVPGAGDVAVAWWAYSVAWSPNGQYLAVGHVNGDRLAIFNTSDWTVYDTPAADATIYALLFSLDSDFLYFHSSTEIIRYDIATKTNASFSSGATISTTYGLAFSPDATQMAAVGNSGVFVLDAATGAVVGSAPISALTSYRSVCFSPDGSLLVAGRASAPFLHTWATADWTHVEPAWQPTAEVTSTLFSADTALPSREIRTFDHNGSPISAVVALLDPQSLRRLKNVTTPANGIADAQMFAPGQYVAALVDDRSGAMEYAFSPFAVAVEAQAPVELYLGYGGTPATMSGRVTVSTGGPADEVVIRAWASRKLVTRVYPDSNGDWTAQVPPGEYDVTYIKAGCAPVVHGPYTVAAT